VTKVTVLGAGAWGSALCFPLSGNQNEIWLWDRTGSVVESIREERQNPRHLAGITLPAGIHVTGDLREAVRGALAIIVAVPTHAFREVLALASPCISQETAMVSGAKGIEPTTHLRMTQVIAQALPAHPQSRIACISGPNFAIEVARQEPTTTVVGAKDDDVGRLLQDILMTPAFRVYTNPDVTGVELGGAVKNIIAIAVGIAEGMGLGYNARAGLITRGLAEMARLGVALGAHPLTFAGLSGLGDLVLTCTGEYSRNRRCGVAVGRGEPLQHFLETTQLTVEGIRTTQAVRELSVAKSIELPVTEQVYEVLFAGKPPQEGVRALMSRLRKHESEEVARYR
jgi:glycerol-3-phosphate dehydrogenase (NAD(P)+)